MRQTREVMERQVLQLVRLVDDLLDVNRINRGKLELRLEPLVLEPVVQQAIEVCRPLLDRHGHRLRVELPAMPLRLHGDAARLTQVFGNLLTNAAKYTPPGGDITLRVQAAQGQAEVVVQDNGEGIPPDQLDRIFELFTQVDRTLERAQGGLGIGLMLVKRLVEMHGGTVQARSEGHGKGSTFTVRLPLDTAAVPAPQVRPAVPAADRRRILVVDDNRDAAESLVLVLTLDGHDAHTAHSGAQALALGAELRPDVVLMDIGMPLMNGHEACRRMRQQAWGRGIPVIALTGLGQHADRQLTEQAGFDAHLVKPVDMAVLRAMLAGMAPHRSGRETQS